MSQSTKRILSTIAIVIASVAFGVLVSADLDLMRRSSAQSTPIQTAQGAVTDLKMGRGGSRKKQSPRSRGLRHLKSEIPNRARRAPQASLHSPIARHRPARGRQGWRRCEEMHWA